METKHTPGPWVARLEKDGWVVAHNTYDCVAYIRTLTVADANAALIAAAPELLEACQAASAYLADPASEFEKNRKVATEMIHSAIARAKGK